MIALEQIHQLPLREKLLMMEVPDFARDPEQVDVPSWHKEILDERERLIQEGQAKFIDWEEARKQMRQALS